MREEASSTPVIQIVCPIAGECPGVYGKCSLPVRDGLSEELDALGTMGEGLKQIAFAPDGSWVVLFDSSGYFHSELP